MGLGFHDRLDQRDGRWADLGGLAHHALRCPLGVTPVRARHVLRDCRVPVGHARSCMGRDPRAVVEDLDGGVGETRLDRLAQQPERYRVVMIVDLDVIVGRDAAALPLGITIGLVRQLL